MYVFILVGKLDFTWVYVLPISGISEEDKNEHLKKKSFISWNIGIDYMLSIEKKGTEQKIIYTQ